MCIDCPSVGGREGRRRRKAEREREGRGGEGVHHTMTTTHTAVDILFSLVRVSDL